MKLIIAGSRDLTVSLAEIQALLNHYNLHPTEIVSGGARGIDACGEDYARMNGIPVKVFQADWDRFGPSAGPRRNRQMSFYGDALLLIWDGESRGSRSMKTYMLDEQKPIYEALVKDVQV